MLLCIDFRVRKKLDNILQLTLAQRRGQEGPRNVLKCGKKRKSNKDFSW